MAEKKIALGIEINAADGAKSLKQLKEEFKQVQTELEGTIQGTEKYYQTIEKLATTKDDIKRLNEQINAQAGLGNKIQNFSKLGASIAGGFAAAQGAMALFGSESKELEQTLMKIQAAMSLAQGLSALEGIEDAFKDAARSAKDLWKTLLANPYLAVIGLVVALGAATLALIDRMNQQETEAQKLQREYEELKKSTETLTKSYDIQIKSLEGLKKNEGEILEISRKKLEADVVLAAKAASAATARAKEDAEKFKRMREEKGLLNDLLKMTSLGQMSEAGKQVQYHKTTISIEAATKATEDLQMARANLQAFDNAQTQKEIDRNEAAAKKRAEEREKKRLQDLKDGEMDIVQIRSIEVLKNDEIKKSSLDIQAWKDQQQAIWDEADRKRREAQLLRNKEFAVSTAHETLKLVSDLNELFANKSKESQKRAFNINKGVAIAETTISTFQSAQKAYTSQIIPGDPTSPIRATIAASLAIASGLARVAAIAKTKFDDSGSGSSSISGGGGSIGTFSQNNLTNGVNNTSTLLSNVNNGTNNNNPVKVYVTEHDITNAQQSVNAIVNKAVFK